MTYEDYVINGPVYTVDKLHECLIEGTKVICNYIHCTYEDVFTNSEDAEVAAEIHEET